MSSCIVELYDHLGIFKNTREVREALGYGSCSSMHFSRILKNSRVLRQLNNALGRVIYFFNKLSAKSFVLVKDYVFGKRKEGRPAGCAHTNRLSDPSLTVQSTDQRATVWIVLEWSVKINTFSIHNSWKWPGKTTYSISIWIPVGIKCSIFSSTGRSPLRWRQEDKRKFRPAKRKRIRRSWLFSPV